MKTKLEGLLLAVLMASCAKPVEQITCGEGTTRDGARCIGIPAVTCANGTMLESGACVPNISACEAGTHVEAGRCVVDATACAEGTALENGRCVVKPGVEPPTRWKANVRICPQGSACYDPSLGTDGQGAVYVAYTKEVAQGLGVGVAVSTDDGAAFSEKKVFEVSSRYAMTAAVLVDSTGGVLVAYTEYEPDPNGMSNGVGNVWLARSTDKGATWAAPIALTPQTDTTLDYMPKLSRVGSTLWALWQRYTETTAAMMLAKSTDDGATWSEPFEAPGDPGTYGSFGYAHGVSALANGHLLLPYQSTSYDLTTGGYVSQAGVLNIDPGSPGVAPSSVQVDLKGIVYSRSQRTDAEVVLAADGLGQKQCVVFVDMLSRDYDLFATTGPLTTETKPKALALGASAQLGPSLAMSAAGDCHLVWLDNRRGGWELFSGVLHQDGTLSDKERVSDTMFVEDGKTSFTTLTDLVLSGSQRYAVWSDLRDGRTAVYFARGPLEAPGM